jgi:hypothetical protein
MNTELVLRINDMNKKGVSEEEKNKLLITKTKKARVAFSRHQRGKVRSR